MNTEDEDEGLFGTIAEPSPEPKKPEPKPETIHIPDPFDTPDAEDTLFPKIPAGATAFDRVAYARGLFLLGEEYCILRRILAYSLVGAIACKHLPVRWKGIETDARISCIFDMNPESGKGVIKSFIVQVCKRLGMTIALPPPGFHGEQLLGYMKKEWKTVVEEDPLDPDATPKSKKKQVIEPRPGYLSLDVVAFDEAAPLLYNDDHENSRHYLKISQDTYGTSMIHKWRHGDDVAVGDALQYSSPSTAVIFIQPDPDRKLATSLLTTGFLRRFFLTTVNLDAMHKVMQMQSRISGGTTTAWIDDQRERILKAYALIKERVETIKDRGFVYGASPDDQKAIEELIGGLSVEALGVSAGRGEALQRHTIDNINTLANKLLTMSCIRSLVDNKDKQIGVVTSVNVSNALQDLREIWLQQVDFIAQQFELSQREETLALASAVRSLLKSLYDRGVTDEDTGMPRDEFIALAAEVGHMRKKTAEALLYQDLRRQGIIKTNTKHGRPSKDHPPKVWVVGKDVEPFLKGIRDILGDDKPSGKR